MGYLGLALLSIVGTPSPYLGLVEMSRQLKFFIVFLFAVINANRGDGKVVKDGDMRIFRIGRQNEKYPVSTPTAERYENNWQFHSYLLVAPIK